jgi:predicted XRE-type DNA-binding protein
MEAAEGLHPNASAADIFKYELCEKIVKYMLEKKITQREMAKLLGVDEARVSEVVHYKLRKLTADRLLSYHERLDPHVRFKIAR